MRSRAFHFCQTLRSARNRRPVAKGRDRRRRDRARGCSQAAAQNQAWPTRACDLTDSQWPGADLPTRRTRYTLYVDLLDAGPIASSTPEFASHPWREAALGTSARRRKGFSLIPRRYTPPPCSTVYVQLRAVFPTTITCSWPAIQPASQPASHPFVCSPHMPDRQRYLTAAPAGTSNHRTNSSAKHAIADRRSSSTCGAAGCAQGASP